MGNTLSTVCPHKHGSPIIPLVTLYLHVFFAFYPTGTRQTLFTFFLFASFLLATQRRVVFVGLENGFHGVLPRSFHRKHVTLGGNFLWSQKGLSAMTARACFALCCNVGMLKSLHALFPGLESKSDVTGELYRQALISSPKPFFCLGYLHHV